MRVDNYYEILGIGRDADDEVVKQAFRDLAKLCHPDRNPGDANAEQQFKNINTAYEALKDGDRREAYNEWLLFADTRERSGFTQWARLFALIFFLVFGPLVLYLAIANSGGPSSRGQDTAEQPAEAKAQTAHTPPQQPVKEQAKPGTPPLMPDTNTAKATTTPAPSTETKVAVRPAKATAQPVQAQQNTRQERVNGTSEIVAPETTEALALQSGGNTSMAKTTPAREEHRTAQDTAAADVHATSRGTVKAAEAENPAVMAPPSPGEQTRIAALSGKTQPDQLASPSGVNQFADCDQCPIMAVVYSEARDAAAKETGWHPAASEPFAISRSEITIAEWDACVADGVCPRYTNIAAGDARRSMRDVSPRDAASYVNWLSRKTGQSYRLAISGDLDPGAAQPERTRREAANTGCNAEPGWEWLDDNPACSRRATAGRTASDVSRGFRVTRALPTQD